MAENSVTQPKEMKFGASYGLYHMSDTATAVRVFDQLDKQLKLLNAMLLMTYGEPGEIFRSINDDGQDNYMWGCADIAGECLELLKTYMELARNKHLS